MTRIKGDGLAYRILALSDLTVAKAPLLSNHARIFPHANDTHEHGLAAPFQ